MSDYALNLKRLVERAEQYFPRNEILTRSDDGSIFRYTYRDYCARVRCVASALDRLGVGAGERVATLMWNNHQHLELYFAVPCSGRVLHTANLRLSDEHLAYTLNHAEDTALFFSPDLLSQVESIAPLLKTGSEGMMAGRMRSSTAFTPPRKKSTR